MEQKEPKANVIRTTRFMLILASLVPDNLMLFKLSIGGRHMQQVSEHREQEMMVTARTQTNRVYRKMLRFRSHVIDLTNSSLTAYSKSEWNVQNRAKSKIQL